MKNRTKKLFKITGITLGALIVFLSAVIAFSINFIFTPEKLIAPHRIKRSQSKHKCQARYE